MNNNTRIHLSAMMVFQFFVWGTWYVTMGTRLFEIDFTGGEIGRAYNTVSWAAIIAPFFIDSSST